MRGSWPSLPITIVFPMVLFTGLTKGLLAPRFPRYFREPVLVAQELIIRHRARRILIVCPAALQVQWHDQMRDKFGLEFRIVDSKMLHDLRRERGLHVNPWTHFPRLITSIDFLKRERPLRLFSEILPAEGESVYPRKFDLLI